MRNNYKFFGLLFSVFLAQSFFISAQEIRSFDVFDTLLGRLHYYPCTIFQIVEENYPFPGFYHLRKKAEYESNGTLPDTYRHLKLLTGLSDVEIHDLMQFEMDTELSQVFPIVQNLQLVQDGDIIVSDTYYNSSQIKQLLNKVGLTKEVTIYAYPGGKSSGFIWEELSKDKSISLHLGDNGHSDVLMAKKYKIPAEHYTECQLSPNEKVAQSKGHQELAFLMRALRLQNPYTLGSPEYLIWNEQSQLNVPILILSSFYLNDFCRENKKNQVLFTTRDGCLWIRIFQQLFPEYNSVYFHSSRRCYELPSVSFVEYVSSIYTKDSVIVDGQGTGYSCENFFRHYLHIAPCYMAIVNRGCGHQAVIRWAETERCSAKIEMLNYDVVGSLCDFQNGKPLRLKPEYDLKYIDPAHACIKKCVEMLSHYSFKRFDKSLMKFFIEAIETQIVITQFINHTLDHQSACGNENNYP